MKPFLTNCKTINCKNQTCRDRHPKSCRFRDLCRFQTRCCYSHRQEKRIETKTDELSLPNDEIEKLKSDNILLKKDSEMKLRNTIKIQIEELTQLKSENKNLKQSIQEVLEMHKVTLAFKEDIIKGVYEVKKNNIEKQDKMLEEIENISEDFYNFRDICKEQNVKVHNRLNKSSNL